jgi:hypothetical protein
MSKFKLSMLLVLVLTVMTSSALPQVQAAARGTGTAVISDGTDLSDTITYAMTGVTVPADGGYEGWLVSGDGEKTSTGVMAVGSDGVISHKFTSDSGENLIANYHKVQITEESSGAVVFSSEIPSAGMTHIRHLVSEGPGGEGNGILFALKGQLDVAIANAALASSATDVAGIHKYMEVVVNALEGEGGSNYGDLNSDGATGDEGDGTGAITHAQNRNHALLAADASPSEDDIIKHADLLEIVGKNTEDWAAAARDKALTVLATTNLSLAKVLVGPGANTVSSNLDAARNGFDADNDGVVAVTATEGGATQAYIEGQLMATYTIRPGASAEAVAEEEAGPLGLPSVGDTAIQSLMRIGLMSGIVLLFGGGLLVVAGRVSRRSI